MASIDGAVDVQTAVKGWVSATVNQVLCQGDSIRVGARSRAAIALINDAVVRLDQNTTMRLLDIAGKKEETSFLELVKGAIQTLIRAPRRLAINTPYLNGSIEGTEFLVRVEQDRASLAVLEGKVRIENEQGRASVAAGQVGSAASGQAPAVSVLVRPQDAVQWTLYYPPILSALDPATQDALQRVALLLTVGRADEARTAIDTVLQDDSRNGLAYALRAVIRTVQNERQAALLDGQQAVALSPTAAAKIALSYAQQANFLLEDARDTLLSATQSNPQDSLAWARLSEIFLMLGDSKQARAAADKAVALGPGESRAHTVLGFAALADFNNDAAKIAFGRVIELDSANPLGHLGLGLADISSGDLGDGRRELEVAVALDSQNALLRAYLGKAYFEENRPPLDSQQFAIAKDLDPRDPTAFLYAGILKQTQNMPVAAAKDLQTSIDLNDNRAVYRSRLLLDKDRAARGTSLARAYNDLGFSQLALRTSSESLAIDPANSSAHRFLSDGYRNLRRREIARVSELLQAQLMQDININPVQPSAAETNLNIASSGGPSAAGLNEFTPLFQRNQTQLDFSGLWGNQDMRSGEAVLSSIYDKLSVSAGAFRYDTEGFRPNNELEHSIYNVYAQAALTPQFNLQAELRHRESDSGDIVSRFDPTNFYGDLDRHFEEDSARIGARFTPAPSSNVLLSVIYSDRRELGRVTQQIEFPDFGSFDLFSLTTAREYAYQAEAQYLYQSDPLNVTGGLAYAHVNQLLGTEQTLAGFPLDPFASAPKIRDYRGYAYANLNLPQPVIWTLGLSYQKYEEDAIEFHRLNPKLGVQWRVTDALTLRGAYLRVVKPALASNRTVEPTQIAGFNQYFDDANATKSTLYAGGLDWRISGDFTAGVEYTRRELAQPAFVGETASFEDRDEWVHRAYAYWTPAERLSLGFEPMFEKFESVEGSINPDLPLRLKTLSLPVRAQYFDPNGLFAGIVLSYVDQELERSVLSTQPAGESDFVVTDIAVGYRLPGRRGIASLAAMNVFDKKMQYLDDSFRAFQDEPSTGPYVPRRTIMLRVTLHFDVK